LVPLPQEERNRPAETGLQARAIVGGFLRRPADAERLVRTLVWKSQALHANDVLRAAHSSRWTPERLVYRSPPQENIKFIDRS